MGIFLTSPQVKTPLLARNAPIPLLIPQSSRTEISFNIFSASHGFMIVKPFGLWSFAAYFAVVDMTSNYGSE